MRWRPPTGEHNNRFAHYGGPGFNMFSTGYIGKLDDTGKLQSGFDFSEVAATASQDTMLEQIPRLLSEVPEGISFDDFFMRVINSTLTTRDMVSQELRVIAAQTESSAYRRSPAKLMLMLALGVCRAANKGTYGGWSYSCA